MHELFKSTMNLFRCKERKAIRDIVQRLYSNGNGLSCTKVICPRKANTYVPGLCLQSNNRLMKPILITKRCIVSNTTLFSSSTGHSAQMAVLRPRSFLSQTSVRHFLGFFKKKGKGGDSEKDQSATGKSGCTLSMKMKPKKPGDGKSTGGSQAPTGASSSGGGSSGKKSSCPKPPQLASSKKDGSPCPKKKESPCPKPKSPCPKKEASPCPKPKSPCPKKEASPCPKPKSPCPKPASPCPKPPSPCPKPPSPSCKKDESPCSKPKPPCPPKPCPYPKKEESPCGQMKSPCPKPACPPPPPPCPKKENPCSKKSESPCSKPVSPCSSPCPAQKEPPPCPCTVKMPCPKKPVPKTPPKPPCDAPCVVKMPCPKPSTDKGKGKVCPLKKKGGDPCMAKGYKIGSETSSAEEQVPPVLTPPVKGHTKPKPCKVEIDPWERELKNRFRCPCTSKPPCDKNPEFHVLPKDAGCFYDLPLKAPRCPLQPTLCERENALKKKGSCGQANRPNPCQGKPQGCGSAPSQAPSKKDCKACPKKSATKKSPLCPTSTSPKKSCPPKTPRPRPSCPPRKPC